MPDQQENRLGHLVGEYRLVHKLGGGGFGTVYLAEHAHEHTYAAVKVLSLSQTSGGDFKDFINEARTMRLRHPHIVPLLDFGISQDGLPFLVMEYAPQGTLRDRHPKGERVPLSSIVSYVDQLASALQYAHDRRVIHRDIKPANILVRANGTLMVSDFGIAKFLEQSLLMNQQKLAGGTPEYMAPEQHKGKPCFASDQYALAVVIYEWICGVRPFQGTAFAVAAQHMNTPPPSLLGRLPELSEAVERVIFKALAKAPEDRFERIEAMASAFHEAVQPSPRTMVLSSSAGVETPPPPRPQTNTDGNFHPNRVLPAPPQSVTQSATDESPQYSAHPVPPPRGLVNPYRTSSNRKRQTMIVVALVVLFLGSWSVSANPGIIANIIHGNSTPPRTTSVRQLIATKTATDMVKATGPGLQPAVEATGMLLFTSGSTSDYSLASGTSFNGPNGITVVTDSSVTIPAANLSALTPGRASVHAHVSPKGKAGNIAVGAINETCCVGSSIYVKNDVFSGGMDATSYTFLQESDITLVTNAHQGRLKSAAQNDIKGQMKPDEHLLGAINCNDPDTTEDVLLGDQGSAKAVTTAHVTVSVSCNAKVSNT